MANSLVRWAVCMLALLGVACSAAAQGIVIPGAGPINRSMAGASTAAPVDFGSTYWNIANLSGLERPEFLIGSELLIPSTHLTTSVPAGAINGVFPPENRYGVARSNSGVVPNVATGVAFRLDDESPWTFGVGIFGAVGGTVNFAGNPNVPLLAPRQAPLYFGFGPIWANISLLTINPSASLRLNERLSVAAGPVISSTSLGFSPAFFAPGPRDATGLPTFPAGTNGRTFWGGGFQLGLLYELNENWNLGFSYKSPIWQERWSFNAATPDLFPRHIGIQANVPAIYSWGIAYKGIERALIDVDLRYFDYANTALYGQSVQDGGVGWNSVLAVALGGQYALTDRLTLRAGYLYNTNPIPDTATLFNVQLPGITTNTLSLGSSLSLTEDITLSLAWVHGFRNAIEGGVREEPVSTAKLDTQYDSIVAGLNIQFGGRPRERSVPAAGRDSL